MASGLSIDCRRTDVQAVDDERQQLPHPVIGQGALIVRQTDSAGRGVFACRSLSAGTLVEVSHVLLFPPDEYHRFGRHTRLDDYTYVWSKSSSGSTMALALGIGSLFNHAYTAPNVSYTLHKPTETIRYTLARDVEEGEELCISYGSGRMWWETPCAQEEEEQAQHGKMYDDQQQVETELLRLNRMGLYDGIA